MVAQNGGAPTRSQKTFQNSKPEVGKHDASTLCTRDESGEPKIINVQPQLPVTSQLISTQLHHPISPCYRKQPTPGNQYSGWLPCRVLPAPHEMCGSHEYRRTRLLSRVLSEYHAVRKSNRTKNHHTQNQRRSPRLPDCL